MPAVRGPATHTELHHHLGTQGVSVPRLAQTVVRGTLNSTAPYGECPVTIMEDKPIMVTDADFAQVIKEKPFVIVVFWAERCVLCRAIAPIVVDLATEN